MKIERKSKMKNESKAEILRFFMIIGLSLMSWIPMIISYSGIIIFCVCGPFVFIGSLILPDLIFEVNTII